MTRTLLSKNKDITPEDSREVDNDGMVKLMRARGFVQAAIEADNMRLIYIFSRKETQPLLDEILANKPIMIEWQKYLAAEEEWKTTLSILKEMRGRK
jgi:hypothetical protein